MDLTTQEIVQYAITVVTLVILEGLLSADNALVLAVLVRNLPKDQQGKALKYGIWGAFFFRAIGILLAGQLLKYWYLKALGASYLLYLSVMHFYRKWRARKDAESPEAIAPVQSSFWRVVVAVELTDIAFSIDSIIAAVALSPNIYIIYLGGVLGIITMRFVATWFIKLLDVYTALETSAYILVGWIAIKLGAEIIHSQIDPKVVHGGLPGWLFWSVMGIVFFGGFMVKKKPEAESASAPLEPTEEKSAT
jgi:YkoY family integral membrane protein